MKILITGATGFIGMKLVEILQTKRHEIFALCRNLEKAKAILPDNCHIIIGDITDKKSLTGCCDGIDMVYQLVGLSGNELPSDYQFKRFRKVNVEGLRNIVEEAQRAKVKRFVQVSSIAAMGIVQKMPISGQSKCEPYLPYQVSKREGELLVLDKVKNENFPAIIIRPAKVYGIGGEDSYQSIIKMCKKGFFPKVGIRDTMVSHCYIDDLITTLALLTEKGRVGEIYNCATEKPIGFYESVNLVAKLMDTKVLMIPIPRWAMASLAYLIERVFGLLGKKSPVTRRNVIAATTDRIYDFTANKRDIGFVSSVTMEEGIRRCLEYNKEKGLF